MKDKKPQKNPPIKDFHPSLDIVESHGTQLRGKKIVLCVTGSVAAYKSIEIARLLMRHGAQVTCVLSKSARNLIKPEYFKWATGNEVITSLTGNLEHIKIADYSKSDFIIVYPCTANTLGKLANGIDDTPISTVLTVGFGSKIPIFLALAMHKSMYENQAISRNIKFLKNKVHFISPKLIEGKAKAPEPQEVINFILDREIPFSKIKNKEILITAGPTHESIDPVRIISNISSGKTGILLAAHLAKRGSKVTLIYGPGSEEPPKEVKTLKVKTTIEMLNLVKKELKKKKFDVVILAAAPADYLPINPKNSKIQSKLKLLNIKLKKAPKIIELVKKIQKNTILVGFKAEANISDSELIKRAQKKMYQTNADLIIANDIGKNYKNPDYNKITIINKKSIKKTSRKLKKNLVKIISDNIEKIIIEKQSSKS